MAKRHPYTVCCQLRGRDGGVRLRPPRDGPSGVDPLNCAVGRAGFRELPAILKTSSAHSFAGAVQASQHIH